MRRDIAIGIALLGLCALLYWQAGRITVPPFVPISPASYPRVVLGILALLALWLIAQSAVMAARGKPRAKAKAADHPPNYRLVFVCFVVFGLYVIGLSLIGFLAATFLFVLGLAWLMGPGDRRELPKLAAVAAGTTLVTYLVFEKYLHVFLPRGLLF